MQVVSSEIQVGFSGGQGSVVPLTGDSWGWATAPGSTAARPNSESGPKRHHGRSDTS